MAETLISPGVLARENDQSQVTSQPLQAGACIVGPTVLGKVNIPRLVTSYSEYLANFGSTFTSGSDTFTYFTSISAYNYFNNGGTSLIVSRVASGSWTPASSSAIRNEVESGAIQDSFNMTGSATGGEGAGSITGGSNTNVIQTSTTGTGAGATFDYTIAQTLGRIDAAEVLDLSSTTGGINNATSVGTFTGEVTTTNGNGSGLTVDVVTALPTNATFTAARSLTLPGGAVTADAAGTTAAIATSSSGTGTGATVLVTSDGVNITSVVISGVGSGGTYVAGDTLTVTKVNMDADGSIGTTGGNMVITLVQADLTTELTSVTANVAGTGYAAGDEITIALALIGSPAANLVITLQAADIAFDLTSLTVGNAAGSGYVVGEQITLTPVAPIVGASNIILTLVDADILDANAFTLETLTDGIVMNSGGGTPVSGSNGTLTDGTVDNVRWEIQGRNESTGTFSVVIRQGNDTATAKRVLEIFPNVSLDPKSSNYISRIIGDMTKTRRGAGTDLYCQSTGSYANASRYVRVKEVNYKTPNYFDNNGVAKSEFTASIPDNASGSFGGAEGRLFLGAAARYYDEITDIQTQGFTSTEMQNYTDAFNLLANKDDYQYNIITSPGLYYAASMMATPLNTLIQNTQTRGDAIAVIDLVDYGQTVTAATTQAASIDNSYAAAYWPWVQLNDPDSRQLVWSVPSALIPGVYAFNDRTSEAWFAPAGINRGGLSTVVQAERKLTQTNRDNLYTGKVNPIATFPGKGVVVFGQKTLQSQASALDRINVRRLLIALKSFIVQIADNLVFEQNTAATRNNFLSQVNPYLESVQQRQGLYAFKVQMDAANNGPDVVDRNQMVGAIYIQPTKTAEFIYLDFNILPTGAEFPS